MLLLLGLEDNSSSDSSLSSETSTQELTSIVHRGKGKEYHFHQEFEQTDTMSALKLAWKSLKDELFWSRTNKKYEKSTKAHKQSYRCNLVESRCKIQCSSVVSIIKPSNSTKVEVHRTTCPNDHIEKQLTVTIAARLAID